VQPQNIFALLPDPEGKNTSIVIRNSAGQQEISQPDYAVRVASAAVVPTPPYAIDQPAVRRLFGTALDAVPTAEVRFTLNFELSQDVLDAKSQAQIPDILRVLQERRSTNISVTGHTDTTGDPASNYQLGLRRAEGVAQILRAQGVASSSLFVTSHGEADLLVKTPRGVAEQLNRRVEVIVR
jgi:outer membrane protein OmpA-like peptidoglycan-associated protein